MSLLSDILQGVPVNAVLRERIELLVAKLEIAEKECRALTERVVNAEQKNRRLSEELETLKSQEAARPPKDEFVEYRGALFRRTKAGSFEPSPYCPSCRIPMTSPGNAMNFFCAICGRPAGFAGREIWMVTAALKTELGISNDNP